MSPAKSPRTARRSKREQLEQRAKAAEEAPPPVLQEPEPALPEIPLSPIAEWLLAPTPQTWTRLQVSASLGRLTKADLQSAIVAQMHVEVEHFNRDPGAFEYARKAYVNRQRLLRSLLDVVKQSAVSGPTQLVRFVWPAHYDPADRGDDVRQEEPT